MILLIGATGTTGRILAAALSKAGVAYRCAARDRQRAQKLLPKDVEIVLADLEHPETIEAAASGCDRMYLLSGDSPQMAELQNGAIDAAKRAGVGHVVKLSSLMYDPAMLIPAQHREIEEYLQASGLDWTILRPNFFMQNLLSTAGIVRGESRILLPFRAAAPITMIDAVDIANVAHKVLTESGHEGKTYALTGPQETLGHFSVLLFDSLERSIAYVQISRDQVRQNLERKQTPEWIVDQQLGIEQIVNAGGLDIQSDDVANIIGEPPRTLSKFLSYNVITFEE